MRSIALVGGGPALVAAPDSFDRQACRQAAALHANMADRLRLSGV